MSAPFRPWCPISAARAINLNAGEMVDDLLLRYSLDPTMADPGSALEALQRRRMSAPLLQHFARWEVRAAAELAAMHQVGVRIDRKGAARLISALDGMLARLEQNMAQNRLLRPLADHEVRLWLLAEGLPINSKVVSLDEHLKSIDQRHPLIPTLRRYRRLHALRIQHPWLLADAERVHPQHHHLCQATGRTTTKDPAITGIPKEMRPLVIASPGYELFEIDYKSMEVGVAAGLSGDAHLLAAYRSGDAIGSIARIIFPEMANLDLDDIKKRHGHLRSLAKPIIYGTLYGQSPQGLADRTGKPEAEARRLQERLFGTCHAFKAMVEQSTRTVARTRTVELGCGFERRIPDGEADYRLRTIAANAPIQAGAGIIFRMASVLAGPRLRAIGARLILPIHDAYVCETPSGTRSQATAILGTAMEVASAVFFQGRLRLRVDVNDSAPTCWNKDGAHDSLNKLIADPAYRLP